MWVPQQEWAGGEAFLIGGGPSLKTFDFEILRGRNVIGCNDAFRLGGDIVNFCIFGDGSFYQRAQEELKSFTGRCVTNQPSFLSRRGDPKLKHIHLMHRHKDGLGENGSLGWLYSTGAMAIDLALQLGALQVFLLGYDLCAPAGVCHWHGNTQKPQTAMSYARFLRGFKTIADKYRVKYPGATVVNVTDGSTHLHVFPKLPFKEVFA